MKISIIVAVYNDIRVVRAIASLLEQRLAPGDTLEIIVVDDSDARDVVACVGQYRDVCRVVHCEERRGLYHARNVGLSCASGDVIGFLNADDWYTDDSVLSDIIGAFRIGGNPPPDCVFARTVLCDRMGRPVRCLMEPSLSKWDILMGRQPPDPGAFWSSRVMNASNGYRDEFQIAGDYEYFLRTVYRGKARQCFLDRVTTCMEMGGVSQRNSPRLRAIALRERVMATSRNGLGLRTLYSPVLLTCVRFLAFRAFRFLGRVPVRVKE